MNHTKIALIAILFIVGVYSDCTTNPLKPEGWDNTLWTDTAAGVDAPADLTFCKGLTGQKICLTAAGLTKAKEMFVAKREAFIAARKAHLERWNTMEKDFAATLPKLADTIADIGAEVNSTVRLMARLYVNMQNRWQCKYYEADDITTGAVKGAINLDDCPGRENITEWAMKFDYKSVKKSVMKKIINILLALNRMQSMMDPQEPIPQRFLQAANYDFNNPEDLAAFMNLTEQEAYNYLKDHQNQIQEVDFSAARVNIRKMMKPLLKAHIVELLTLKNATFSAQRSCFKHLFKAEANLKCMAIRATNAVFDVDSKKVVYVKKTAMNAIKQVCYDFIQQNQELGQAWDEAQGMMYFYSRYPAYKSMWINFKRMLVKISKSQMRIGELLNIVLESAFDDGGYYDQVIKFYTDEYTALIARMTEVKVWEMNFRIPENCTSYMECPQINAWFGANGVAEVAKNLGNFRSSGANESLAEFSDQLMALEEYKKIFAEETAKAGTTTDKVYAAATMEEAAAALMEAFNMTQMRMLQAESDVTVIEVESTDDNYANAVDVDSETQADAADIEVAELDTSDSAGLDSAVDNISEEDVGGNIGDDSNSDDIDTETNSGWSFMTWLMVIFGALFVLTLVGGACYVCQQRKDAANWQANDTEMHGTHH